MIRRPPRSTPLYSSAASDVYKRQPQHQKGNQFFPKSGQGNFPRPNVLPQRPQETGNKPKAGTGPRNAPTQVRPNNPGFRKPVTCYYCRKPGHIMANCRQRLAQKPPDNSGEQPVQVVHLPIEDSTELRKSDKLSSLVSQSSECSQVDPRCLLYTSDAADE